MLRERLAAASRAISEGRAVSHSLDANGLATPVALRMLAVGERSGNMGEMMERIAGFHDEELARWVDWFTRLFEPMLMAVIGLVIGAIVMLMYMPIFELAGKPPMTRRDVIDATAHIAAGARAAAAAAPARGRRAGGAPRAASPTSSPRASRPRFRFQPLRMEDLRGSTPAFDLVPFAECSQQRLRRCCATPTDGLLLAIGRSFLRASSRRGPRSALREPFAWRLVHRGDLVAYLAQHEETLRALDAVRERGRVGGEADARGRGPLAQERSATSRARWCGWCARPCTTRSRSARATSTSRPLAAGLADQVPHRRHARRRSS